MAKKGRLSNWSTRLTLGKLTLGRSRRARRSRRVKAYENAATFAQSSVAVAQERQHSLGWAANWLPLVALLALAGLLYALFGTPWFYIYDIEVEGNRLLSKEEIYHRSNLEALSVFWLDSGEVRARLLEEPAVAQATVSWFPPSRVWVRMEERVPVAVWQAGDGSFFVDGDGMLFALRGDATEALVIHDRRDESAQPGDKVDATIVRTARELAAKLPERRAFDWEPGLGLSFVTDEGYRVAFGDYTRLDAKVAAFRAFREQIKVESKILLLDLSVPEHPYYQLEE